MLEPTNRRLEPINKRLVLWNHPTEEGYRIHESEYAKCHLEQAIWAEVIDLLIIERYDSNHINENKATLKRSLRWENHNICKTDHGTRPRLYATNTFCMLWLMYVYHHCSTSMTTTVCNLILMLLFSHTNTQICSISDIKLVRTRWQLIFVTVKEELNDIKLLIILVLI